MRSDGKILIIMRRILAVLSISLSTSRLVASSRSVALPSIQPLASFSFSLTVLVTLCGFPAPILGANPVTESFTNSRGRTTTYRYSLKDGWDPAEPRGLLIFFHGNNIGSQTDVLDAFFPWIESVAWERGLIPLVPASPEARGDFNIEGETRDWVDEDLLLIHELLQSAITSSFAVNHDRIVFAGGSKGTCFLNEFIRAYGEIYGGGLLAWCGCINDRDRIWVPASAFRERFKVIVQDTTGDFLYESSLSAYAYYKYTLDLETRGDLAAEGGHCWSGDTTFDQAVDWLLGNIELPEPPSEPHWDRVSSMDHIQGLTLDSDGVLWVARQPPWSVFTTIWRSVDGGGTWEVVSRMELDAVDLDALDETLFLSTHSGLHRSDDNGATFQLVHSEHRGHVAVDSSNGLYRDSPAGVYASRDLGETWSLLLENGSVPRDPILADQSPQIVAHHGMGAATGGDWTSFSNPPNSGPVWSAAWDGSTLWGQAGGHVFRSDDQGVSWDAAKFPVDAAIGYHASVHALGGGRLLVHDGSWTGTTWMSADFGESWFRVYGGIAEWNERWIAAHSQHAGVFATNGAGIFSLHAPELDRKPLDAVTDTDGDGVRNSVDAFPLNRSEYLDTDGDGIGNNLDLDDDGDGVDDSLDGVPLDRFESVDTDSDGLGDGADGDDDGDRVADFFDSFPLDSGEWADTDGDGVGDNADNDDDGDRISDAVDAFPTYASEWLDTDGDGIGNNLDTDDDNDGLTDLADPDRLNGKKIDRLAFGFTRNNIRLDRHRVWPGTRAEMHESKPSTFVYPDPSGDLQAYGFLPLGDGSSPDVQLMIDVSGRGETDGGPRDRVWQSGPRNENQKAGHLAKIYVDRNANGNLTDDGPPFHAPIYRRWSNYKRRTTTVQVKYASGVTLPYGLALEWAFDRDGIVIRANPSSVWVGKASGPDGPVLVVVVDGNGDGLFYRSDENDDWHSDYLCIDLNRDLESDCDGSPDGLERIGLDETFVLDGQTLKATVAPSGRTVDLVAAE